MIDREAWRAAVQGVARTTYLLKERVQNHVTCNGFEQRSIKMILRPSIYKADMYNLIILIDSVFVVVARNSLSSREI